MKLLETVFHLKTLPMFDRLTTAQLTELAGVVREQKYPPRHVCGA